MRRRARKNQRRVGLAVIATIAALLILLPSGIAVASTAVIYWQAIQGLPAPRDSVALDPVIGATELYDRSGQTLLFSVQDPLGDQREWVTLDSLPAYVVDATLVWEDPDFLSTARFNAFTAVTRLWSSVLNGTTPPDPTLTGRLVRQTLLDNQADALREVALVAEINRLYSPPEVLEWYLNTNYYGNDAYGIAAGAQVYLGKAAGDLTLDEAAMLAAIPLAPQYNPFDNEAAARGRQQDVLRALRRAEMIAEPELEQALNTLTSIRQDAPYTPEVAPEFALYARDQAEEMLDSLGLDGARLVARGGLRIVTTLDLDLYAQTDCALRTHIARLGGQSGVVTASDGSPCEAAAYLPPATAVQTPPNTGALTLIDVNTGEIRALVGSATAAAYPPGPTLQPFVYFAAFRTALYNPATMVLDIPKPFPGAQEGLIYTPSNPDDRFRGPMNLRDAMGAGLLPPAADVANRQGIDNILRIAHQMGLNGLNLGAYDLTLLERGGDVSVLDVAYAYSVFASLGDMRGVSVEPVGNGYRGRDPVAVLRIEDASGSVLWEYEPSSLTTTGVLDPGLGYLVTDILADQETRWSVLGENNVLDLPRPSAVVNGVTSDRAHDWTVGYTPHLVAAVWLGREENGGAQSMSLDDFGLNGAAAVWRAVMQYAHERDQLPPETWQRPLSIVEVPVCTLSGTAPNGNCPVRTEVFIDGTQRRLQTDTYWQTFEINRDNGQLATANTPTELKTERVYFVPPPEAFEWWQENDLPLPPTEYDTVSRQELFGSSAILQPEPFAYIGGVVDVRGSMSIDGLSFYQLAYGQGLNPDRWIDIGVPQNEFTRGESLGAWDTSGLNGLYVLRLTVVREDQNIETRVVQVTVDNVPPTVTLSAGEAGQIYRYPGDRVIPLAANVEDNLAIGRVEFYRDDEFLGSDSEWPYELEWETIGVGVETFTATAFDVVGNSASSEITVEIVRAN